MAPLSTTPGGNPVTELPGLSPRFPVMIVGPVLVTVEAPKMAKFSAAPSGTVWAAVGQEVARSSPKPVNAAAHAAADLWTCFLCVELFCMRSDASNESATPGRGEFVFSPGKTTEALDQLTIALRLAASITQ